MSERHWLVGIGLLLLLGAGRAWAGGPSVGDIETEDRPVLRGVLTLVADDHVEDDDEFFANTTALTALLEIKKGGQTFFFAETFAGTELAVGLFGGPDVGTGVPITEASISDFHLIAVGQVPGSALRAFGEAIRVAAVDMFAGRFDLTDFRPVFVELSEAQVDVDEHACGPDGSDPCAVLGRVARFKVKIRFVLVVCGNGEPEAGEECDDGNTVPGDGCDELCRLE